MSLKDQMAADAAIFFNVGEIAELATYQGVQIIGILDYDNGQLSGNPYNNEGQSAKGLYYISVVDIAKIGAELSRTEGQEILGGDQIVHAGTIWYVFRVRAIEGGICTIEVGSKESAWG
jgi:hypothetical protein